MHPMDTQCQGSISVSLFSGLGHTIKTKSKDILLDYQDYKITRHFCLAFVRTTWKVSMDWHGCVFPRIIFEMVCAGSARV